MISCDEAIRHLWEYLDGAVDGADRDRLEHHLERCRRCCAELEFTEELRRFMRDSADDEVPPEVMTRLNATLEELGDR